MITPDNLVSREVHYCVSYLVATVAEGVNYMIERRGEPATELAYQAQELCAPIYDWMEAALQAGWIAGPESTPQDCDFTHPDSEEIYNSWETLCDCEGIDPYEWEVFEHWIISDWLADKLAAKGEKVDKDFAGMIVWARTTSGQGIASDSVIEAICAELNAA